MFQYANKNGEIYEDTWLITYSEAEELRDKYYPIIVKELQSWLWPEMVIWWDCDNEADYHNILKGINYQDCEVINGLVYKTTKTRII